MHISSGYLRSALTVPFEYGSFAVLGFHLELHYFV